MFLGDLIDRGPDSRAVIERVIAGPPETGPLAGARYVCLRGNHEDILLQFLAETGVMTAAGGLVGLLISHAICSAFPSFGLTDYVGEPRVSVAVAGLTAALLGLIGLAAGFFPAREAARLDPVVAMKM